MIVLQFICIHLFLLDCLFQKKIENNNNIPRGQPSCLIIFSSFAQCYIVSTQQIALLTDLNTHTHTHTESQGYTLICNLSLSQKDLKDL